MGPLLYDQPPALKPAPDGRSVECVWKLPWATAFESHQHNMTMLPTLLSICGVATPDALPEFTFTTRIDIPNGVTIFPTSSLSPECIALDGVYPTFWCQHYSIKPPVAAGTTMLKRKALPESQRLRDRTPSPAKALQATPAKDSGK